MAAEYKLVCNYLWSYANDATCMKKICEVFKQIKVQDKYFLKEFLLCYLFKIFVNKLVNMATVKVHGYSKAM